jgi:hypothetical protein
MSWEQQHDGSAWVTWEPQRRVAAGILFTLKRIYS